MLSSFHGVRYFLESLVSCSNYITYSLSPCRLRRIEEEKMCGLLPSAKVRTFFLLQLCFAALQRFQHGGYFLAHAVVIGHLGLHLFPAVHDGGVIAPAQFCADLQER